MAYLNNSAFKGEQFVRIGEKISTNTANCASESTTTLTSNGAITFDETMVNQLVVFGNGQTKAITAFTDGANVTVTPDFAVPAGTEFDIHNATISFDETSRVVFDKAFSDQTNMVDTKGLDMSMNNIRNVKFPTHVFDAVNKEYVDSAKFAVWNFIQTWTGDGTTTSFALTEPLNIVNSLVTVSGVIQNPVGSFTLTNVDSTPYINFIEAPANGSSISVRSTRGANVTNSAAPEEIFTSSPSANQTFFLANEIYDQNTLLVTLDGVVQNSTNYTVELTDPQIIANQFVGNEYKKLVFVEPIPHDVIVRVVNLKGTTFTQHTGTTIVLNDDTVSPNTTDNVVTGFDTVGNTSIFNVTHDAISNRGGLNLFANTTNPVLINLPQMGGNFSPDNFLKVRVVKAAHINSIIINSDPDNYMHYEGHPYDQSGANTGGWVFNAANTVSSIELEWESTFNTWVIQGGFSMWNVYNGTGTIGDL